MSKLIQFKNSSLLQLSGFITPEGNRDNTGNSGLRLKKIKFEEHQQYGQTVTAIIETDTLPAEMRPTREQLNADFAQFNAHNKIEGIPTALMIKNITPSSFNIYGTLDAYKKYVKSVDPTAAPVKQKRTRSRKSTQTNN